MAEGKGILKAFARPGALSRYDLRSRRWAERKSLLAHSPRRIVVFRERAGVGQTSLGDFARLLQRSGRGPSSEVRTPNFPGTPFFSHNSTCTARNWNTQARKKLT